MDWLYLVYALLAALLCFGARGMARGTWNDEAWSLGHTKMLQGYLAVLIMFHHLSQKSCAPWHEQRYIVHGLDVFVPIGYLFVAVFLFFSGFGLYKSWKRKPDYLHGFIRRRILPIVAAFYLSEWMFLAVRAAMGQQMDGLQLLWYITGLQLANPNAWYVIAVPFFYLFFWAAFKLLGKHEGWAIGLVSLLIIGYMALGTFIDHNDWWMRGEWWYNTAHMFPLGLLFAKFEQPIAARLKKGWIVWLLLAVALTFACYFWSEWAQDVWGYYGENWHAPDTVQRRWGTLLTQALTGVFFTLSWLILMLKVRFGNKTLAWMGGITLEFYLVHGLFVDLFGYDFLETVKSLTYIRNVPQYILAVVVCSVPAALLFRLAMKGVNRLLHN